MRAAILALVVLAPMTAPGSAADLTAGAPSASSNLPVCDSPSVLSSVIERQNWAETNTWQDGKRIQALADIRQVYNTTRFASLIEHRHCTGRADLGDGRSGRVHWVISASSGFAGVGYGVEVCLQGQDHWYVWGAACRSLR